MTLSLLLPIATFLVTALVVGWRLQAVESGSMEPLYPVGSLVVVRPVDPSDVKVGSTIAFDTEDGQRQVTHRVVAVVHRPSGLSFRTQGDANPHPDIELVAARAVRGRSTWAVPQLGRVVDWLAWPRGFLLLVVAPGVVLVALELRARRRPSVAPAT